MPYLCRGVVSTCNGVGPVDNNSILGSAVSLASKGRQDSKQRFYRERKSSRKIDRFDSIKRDEIYFSLSEVNKDIDMVSFQHGNHQSLASGQENSNASNSKIDLPPLNCRIEGK